MIKDIFRRDISKQFLFFLLIGLESTVFNYLIFLIFLEMFFISYTISFSIGFISGTILGFYFNKRLTFESKRDAKKEILPYFITYLISLGAGILLIRFLVDSMNFSPLIANIPVLVFTTIVNFIGIKIFAFKNKKW